MANAQSPMQIAINKKLIQNALKKTKQNINQQSIKINTLQKDANNLNKTMQEKTDAFLIKKTKQKISKLK